MAASDLTITDANTKYASLTGLAVTSLQIGEAVGGKLVPLYFNDADNRYYKAISTDANKYRVAAFSWEAGSAGDFISVVKGGDIEVGAILSSKRRYVVSSTLGLIMLDSDLASGDYAYQLFISKSTSVLKIDLEDQSFGAVI